MGLEIKRIFLRHNEKNPAKFWCQLKERLELGWSDFQAKHNFGENATQTQPFLFTVYESPEWRWISQKRFIKDEKKKKRREEIFCIHLTVSRHLLLILWPCYYQQGRDHQPDIMNHIFRNILLNVAFHLKQWNKWYTCFLGIYVTQKSPKQALIRTKRRHC